MGILLPSLAAGWFSRSSHPVCAPSVLDLRGHCQPEGEPLRNINKKPQGTAPAAATAVPGFLEVPQGSAFAAALRLGSCHLPGPFRWGCMGLPGPGPVPACIVPLPLRAQELRSLACQVPVSLMGAQGRGRCCPQPLAARQPGHEPGSPETLHPAPPQRLGGRCGSPFLREGWRFSCH